MNIKLKTRRSKILTGITAAALVAVTCIGVAACSTPAPSGAALENTESSQIWQHYQQIQPPYQPSGKSVYRENLNDAEATQVLGLNTTSFFFQQGRTTPFFWCPSRGGAVPNTAELTNPDFVEHDPNASAGSVTIGNMDPNGVYSPSSSQGTYVMCETAGGQDYLVYSEPDVVQVNAPATWDFKANNGEGGIVVTGAPVMPVCSVKYVTVTDSNGNKKTTGETVCSPPSTATRVK